MSERNEPGTTDQPAQPGGLDYEELDPEGFDPEEHDLYEDEDGGGEKVGPPHPINWNLLAADDAEAEWLELNRWVNWLRHAYGLPASVIPPAWHRHPELVWELSALHTHWLCAYDPAQDGSAPAGWHHDFAEARERLRDWVAVAGTRLAQDRPTRQTIWPGEEAVEPITETAIMDREAEFVEFVSEDVARRREQEDRFYAGLDLHAGGLP